MKIFNFLTKIKTQQKGQALLLAMIMLAVGGLIIGPVVGLVTTGLIAGQKIEITNKEYYAADAGIEKSIQWLRTEGMEEGDTYAVLPPFSIQSYSVGVSITKLETPEYAYSVTSTAGNAQVVANILYTPEIIGVFDSAVTALDGNVIIENNAQVVSAPETGEGNILANGNIEIGNNAVIDGDATATGSISGDQFVAGDTNAGQPPIVFAEVDINPYILAAQAAEEVASPTESASNWEDGGTIPSARRLSGTLQLAKKGDNLTSNANLTITGDFNLGTDKTVVINGDLYVHGNLDIGKNSSLTIHGNLHIGGDVYLDNPAASLEIDDACYVGGNFVSSNGTSVLFSDESVTYIGGYATLYNNNTLTGTATIVVNGNIDIQYNTEVGSAPPNSPLIISVEGNVNLENNGAVEGYFYVPEGHIEIANNASVDGAVVGQSVTVNQNAEVTFRTDGPTDLPGTGEPMVLSIETYDIQ